MDATMPIGTDFADDNYAAKGHWWPNVQVGSLTSGIPAIPQLLST
jgi:hypothetical protein